MKYVFNVVLAFVVIWVVWSVIDHEPRKESVSVAVMDGMGSFDGARIAKTCSNYFQMPVSVEFNNDEMYVSNISDPDEDGLGYVCRMSLYGEIVDTLRIHALNAPKGMLEHDGYLYITDVNRVLKYDLSRDTLVSTIDVPDAKSLFDMAKDRTGRLFVSDTQGERILCIDGDTAKIFAADTLLAGVSGLCSYNGYLYAACQKRIVRIDNAGRMRVFAYTAYPVCGICSDDEGNFLTTDVSGNIYVVSSGKQQLLVSKRQGVSGADIGYIPEQRLLVVPTNSGNSVEIYEIGRYLQQ